jgi:hypothetical protein
MAPGASQLVACPVWLIGQSSIMDRPEADRPTRPGRAARMTTSSVPRIEGIGIGEGAACRQRLRVGGPDGDHRSTGSVVLALGHRGLAARRGWPFRR